MEKHSKKFSCDLPIAEFNEIDRVLRRSKLTRREWLLNAVRKKQSIPSNIIENENLQEIIDHAQKEIDVAYKKVADLYLDAGAALLHSDREKGVQLLTKALDLKAPTIAAILKT